MVVNDERREKQFLRGCLARVEKKIGEQKVFDENDKVFVSGVIEEKLEFSHQAMFERFYKTRVKVIRASGIEDVVPIIVSESLIGNKTTIVGKFVEVAGQLRTCNIKDKNGKRHLDVFVFVRWLETYNNEEEMEEKRKNQVYLNGFVVKEPIYRETPKGREISDVVIAVNNRYGKSAYIPCIIWGRYARYARDRFYVGDNIQLYGRLQSREYLKCENGNTEKKVRKIAYEVSVISIANITDKDFYDKEE